MKEPNYNQLGVLRRINEKQSIGVDKLFNNEKVEVSIWEEASNKDFKDTLRLLQNSHFFILSIRRYDYKLKIIAEY